MLQEIYPYIEILFDFKFFFFPMLKLAFVNFDFHFSCHLFIVSPAYKILTPAPTGQSWS